MFPSKYAIDVKLKYIYYLNPYNWKNLNMNPATKE